MVSDQFADINETLYQAIWQLLEILSPLQTPNLSFCGMLGIPSALGRALFSGFQVRNSMFALTGQSYHICYAEMKPKTNGFSFLKQFVLLQHQLFNILCRY